MQRLYWFLLLLLVGSSIGIARAQTKEKPRPVTIAQLSPPSPSGGCRRERSGPWVERCYQGVKWKSVPGSRTIVGGYDEGYTWLGSNSIIRNGNAIIFDIIAQGGFVRYHANCRSRMFAIVAASDAMVDPSNFQPVNDYIGRSLAYACFISK
jgi:hypothetical protein